MKISIIIVLNFFFSLALIAANNVKLSDEDKIIALTAYFINKDFKMKNLSLPVKPTRPTLSKPKVVEKSKYEKIKTYEDRVKQEEENYSKLLKKTEDRYLESVKKYEISIEKIKNNFNNKNRLRKKKIEDRAIQKAYTTVYGNPYIVQKSLNYDAEEEIFEAELKSTKGNLLKKISIEVPVNEAENFEKYVKKMIIRVAFEIKEDSVKIKYIILKSSKYKYIGKLK